MVTPDPLAPLYVHTVRVRRYLGLDGYNRPKFAPEVAAEVMVDDETRTTTDADGKEVTAAARVAGSLDAFGAVTLGSMIRLPAQFLPARERRVIAVHRGDMNGVMGFPEHIELDLD